MFYREAGDFNTLSLFRALIQALCYTLNGRVFLMLAVLLLVSIIPNQSKAGDFNWKASDTNTSRFFDQFRLGRLAVADNADVSPTYFCQDGLRLLVDDRAPARGQFLERTSRRELRRPNYLYLTVLPEQRFVVWDRFKSDVHQADSKLLDLIFDRFTELQFLPSCERYASYFGGDLSSFLIVSQFYGFSSADDFIEASDARWEELN
ncbi:hypothetical protein [Pseudaestuariivita sp.]|uniref:hypothetical protein n=1 Tax=Pseudaestuariivita sp. TaxID=2211669 RepID=UPI0040582585